MTQIHIGKMGRFPSDRPNTANKKLGQDTGQSDERRGQEARQLLDMLNPVGYDIIEQCCGREARGMVERLDIVKKDLFFTISGKQLGWLRDIKDKLVERGAL